MSSLGQIERTVPFNAIVDRELLSDVQRGDEGAVERLITKYENIVHKKANTYFLIGSDREDVVQEGLIGLYKAICNFDENKRSSFRSFAELCITRQIISSVKSATRQKHGPLNSYVSIYKPIQEGETGRTLLEMIEDPRNPKPYDVIIEKEHYLHIKHTLMKTLTRLEWDVMCYYLKGLMYDEIAQQIGRHEKAVDNALQRIKRKVESLIREKELEVNE